MASPHNVRYGQYNGHDVRWMGVARSILIRLYDPFTFSVGVERGPGGIPPEHRFKIHAAFEKR